MVNRQGSFFLLRIAISVGLLIALFWIMRDNIGNIIEILKKSNKMFFIIALCINAPLSILLSYRLKLLMDGQNISLLMKDAIYLTFVGYFFNNFMPTAIGGDIVKAYYTSKKTNNKLVSYAAVLSDRLFGVMATLFIAIIGIIFVGKNLGNIAIIYAIFFIFAVSILLLYFLLIKKSKGMPIYKENSNINIIGKLKINISRLYNVINLYRDKPSLLIKVILLSLFLQALAIVSIYFFVLCLGGEIYLLKLFLIVPIIWTLSMLPSLNGLGVREGAFVYFLKSDIGAEMSFTASLLWLGITIIYSIIGGIMHLCYPIKVEVTNDR